MVGVVVVVGVVVGVVVVFEVGVMVMVGVVVEVVVVVGVVVGVVVEVGIWSETMNIEELKKLPLIQLVNYFEFYLNFCKLSGDAPDMKTIHAILKEKVDERLLDLH